MSSSDFYGISEEEDEPLGPDLERAGYYLGAWAFVHLLLDGDHGYTGRFQTFLEIVRTNDAESAWKQAFAGIDPAQLDKDFQDYISGGKLVLYARPYKNNVETLSPKVSTLSDAEVHLVWAQRFAARIDGTKERSLRLEHELDEALKSDPQLAQAHHLRGLLATSERRWDAANAALTRAAELEPNEPRFLYSRLRLELAKSDGRLTPQQVTDLRPLFDQLAKIARSAPQLMLAANYQKACGGTIGALALARRAVAVDPFDPIILDAYSSLLEASGRLNEALETQRRAVAFLSEDDPRNSRAIRARLKRLEVPQPGP